LNKHSDYSRRIRQAHRWLSIAFTLTVIANFVAIARGAPPAWVTYSPLPPLALLLLSGLYLFVLPQLNRWRDRPRGLQPGT
jgi:hypothetical protein